MSPGEVDELGPRESTRLLRAIADTSKDLMFAKDREGRLLYANPAALAFVGRSLEEAFGRTDLELVPSAEDALRIMESDRQVTESGRDVDIEERLRDADGRERILLARKSPYRDGSGAVVGVLCIAREITEAKRLERELRASEERLQHAMSAGGLFIWEFDPESGETRYSPNARDALGFELPAAGQAAIDLIHPEDRDRARRSIHAAIGAGAALALEYRIVRPDNGEIVWLRVDARLYEPREGQKRLLGMTQDITKRKHDEEALQDADRRKDEFLAVLAHELRNPLAPMRNGLEILKLAREPALQEQARNMMERQLQHMVSLVDDLLDISRITRGQIVLRRERLDVAAAVSAALETVQPAMRDASHQLTVTLPERPVYVEADRVRLAQAVGNLLSNAAKYTRPGGRIALEVRLRDAEVEIRVKDNGIGIPTAMLARIFEPFIQGEPGSRWGQGGLGIGLALVKQLVEMHGGRVRAQSAGPGTGSEFEITLPAAPPAAAAGDPESSAGDAAATRRRVLVVDDNDDAATSTALMLQLLGNETQTAHDGLEALALGEAFRPDVVLLDVGMPRLDGYQTARRMREQPWGRHVPIVAVTGWGQDADRRAGEEAGFDRHLVKPVPLADLERVLASL